MKEIISSEHELKSDVFKNEAFLWPYLVEVRDKMRVGGGGTNCLQFFNSSKINMKPFKLKLKLKVTMKYYFQI